MKDHETAIIESYEVYQNHKKDAYDLSVRHYVDERGLTKPSEPDPEPSRFRVFEDIRYKGSEPHTKVLGMETLKLFYESAFFSDKQRQGAYENTTGPYPLPDLSRVSAVARSAPATSCVDIERYWNSHTNNGDETIDDRAVDAYDIIANAYNDGLPKDHEFGFYGCPSVIRSYWPVINRNMATWKASNSKLAEVLEHVDMLFPSLYTFYTDSQEDQKRWEIYAGAQLDEAKRIGGDKPVYGFLWPTFHSGNKDFQGKPIPPGYFRRQLDFLLNDRNADGLVVWTLSKTKNIPFSEIPSWWNALEDFMKDLP